jgi:hypothetical protein
VTRRTVKHLKRSEEAVIEAVGDRIVAQLGDQIGLLLVAIDELREVVDDQQDRIATLETMLGLAADEAPCSCPRCRAQLPN